MASTVLDDTESLKTLDAQGVITAIENLDQQIKQAFNEPGRIEIPKTYKDIHRVLFCAMGGSALGAEVVRGVFSRSLKRPILVNRDYHLPAFVNNKTLIFLSSYSGNSTETVNCCREVIERELPTIGLTSGGQIQKMLTEHNLPVYVFKPEHNPAPSRYGIGYMTAAPLEFLRRLQVIEVDDKEIKNTVDLLKKRTELFGIDVPQKDNVAKRTALEIRNKIPVVVTAEFLQGTARVLANQFNETGKNLAASFVLPELNHHLLEGLSFPTSNQKNVIFLFVSSPLYTKEMKRRVQVTKEIVKENNIDILEFIPNGESQLTQAFEVIQFGSYISFYLAMLNATNPYPTPWVETLKDRTNKTYKS